MYRQLAVGLLLTSLFYPSNADAKTLLYTDDFSHTPEWEVVENAQFAQPDQPCLIGGKNAQWDTNNSVYGIDLVNSPPCRTVASPAQSISVPQTYEVRLRIYISYPEQDRNLLLLWKEAGTYLGFHLFGDTIWTEKIIQHRPYSLSIPFVYYNFVPNTWYDVTMQYDQSLGRVRLSINDQLVINAREQPGEPIISSGKFGLAASVGGVSSSESWFDDFTLYSLETTHQIPISPFSQADALWSEYEYDSAQEWSTEPTIQRWGCALTSAVIVLRAHGITHTPTNEELTPLSLNSWLQQEPDGYLWQGHLNWRALTRLARWHHNEYGTTDLEFTYQLAPDDPIMWIRQQIENLRLPILDHGSHFTLAYGYGPAAADILIHDPLFANRISLKAYQNTFHSARLFIPSKTDLSAVTFVVPAATTLQFFVGSTVFPVIPIPVHAIDPANSNLQIVGWIYDIPKPTEPLTIKSSQASIVSFYGYDQTAQVKLANVWIEPTSTIQLDPTNYTITTETSVKPFTAAELSWSLRWQEIKHPLLVWQILEWQNRIPHELEAAFNFLQEKQQLGWLTPGMSQTIKERWLLLLGLPPP